MLCQKEKTDVKAVGHELTVETNGMRSNLNLVAPEFKHYYMVNSGCTKKKRGCPKISGLVAGVKVEFLIGPSSDCTLLS